MPNNLPIPSGALIGRDRELADVAALLRGPGLVTLTGPAGVGKTRLAVEAAAAVSGSFPDGVWMVPLAGVADPALVSQSVAGVLGGDEAGAQPADGLAEAIGEGRVLVVLDTCEHLVNACAELVDGLLRACSQLTVLATSRELLAVVGERTLPLRGLEVPAGDDATPGAWPAIELFCARAHDKNPGFVLEEPVTEAVGGICRRLDGLPLAIELAAAQVTAFSPVEIAQRLDDPFGFLIGARAGDARHHTLAAALDWSHDLLSPPEKDLFRRLSIFTGGCTLEAAQAVGAMEPATSERFTALLGGLVAKSLLVAEAGSDGTRYLMLQTVRAYASARLAEAGEDRCVAARHMRWYIEQAEQAEPELTGEGQQRWVAWLEADHDNLRVALANAIATGAAEEGLRLAGALSLFWRVQGHYAEGRSWLEQVLVVAASASPPLKSPALSSTAQDRPTRKLPALEAKALWGKALLASMVGAYKESSSCALAGLTLFRELGDRRGVARCLLVLGTCDLFTDGVTASISVLRQSIELAREIGDDWCLAHALALCGAAKAQRGERDTGRPMLEESVAVARAALDLQSLAFGLDALGRMAVTEGDYEAAELHLAEALSLAPAIGGTYERAGALLELAAVALGRGEYERARNLLGDGLVLSRQTRSTDALVQCLEFLGRLAQAEGDLDSAERHFDDGLELARGAGGTSIPLLQGLGEVALGRGDIAGARAHFTEALTQARAAGHRAWTGAALHGLGDVERRRGDTKRAARLHHEALNLRMGTGDLANLAASLEVRAGLDVACGRPERAARVFATASTLRHEHGYARPGPAQAAYERDMALVRRSLGREEFAAAWAEGEAMSVKQAVAQLSRARGSRQIRTGGGWGSLTLAEQEVVTLASRGFTNAQISEQMFVSPNTVKAYLKRVFVKLGISSRRDLTRLMTEDPP